MVLSLCLEVEFQITPSVLILKKKKKKVQNCFELFFVALMTWNCYS